MEEEQQNNQPKSSQAPLMHPQSNQDLNGSETLANGNPAATKPQVFYVYRQNPGGFGAGSALANNAYMQMGTAARRVGNPVANNQHNLQIGTSAPLSPMQIIMLQQQQQQQLQQQNLLHQQHPMALHTNNASHGIMGNNFIQTSLPIQKGVTSISPSVVSPASAAKPKFESGQIFYSHHPSNSNIPASRYYQTGYAKLANPPKMNKMDFKSLQKMDKFQASVVNTRVVPFVEKYFHISVPSVPAKLETDDWKEYYRLTANDDFFGITSSAPEWSSINASFQDYIVAYRDRESKIQSGLNNLYNEELVLDSQSYHEPAKSSSLLPDSFVIHSSDEEEIASMQQKKGRGKLRLSFSADAVASANLNGSSEAPKKSRKRKIESPSGKSEASSQSKNKKARKKKTLSVDAGASSSLDQKKASSSSRKTSPKELKGISLKPSSSSVSEKSIEEKRQKLWSFICKKAIPKAAKAMSTTSLNKALTSKRVAVICAREQRKAAVKVIKTQKDIAAKAKKFMKDVLVFWKRNEKEEREARKRAEKEALEKRRIEEEMKEAKRQARKLNFLITQTELYSHFVGKKMDTDAEPSSSEKALPVSVKAIDFDEVSDEALKEHATLIVKDVVQTNLERTRQFDQSTANSNMVVDDETLDSGKEVPQPKMLTCQLKPYQMRGFNWLVNLYNQGINGILADDMGLGKTVQSISLLSYLAETQNAWGPFLVISPASTLHNWLQEIAKFAPKLKAIPYWGTVKDRQILRRYWNPKKLRCEDSPFHICVTSYQMIVSDEKYFQRMQWQYMILDEAHAIKSSSSARWKILLNFNCRNRLLLTGTPIQNSMQELWALLHFIMPGLFDSHDEFSDWFSKDIESHAEKKGDLNEHQLTRLHMILKPFMLRRVKKEVENELGEKVEKEIMIDLSAQQKRLYKGIRDKIPISELLEKSSSNSDSSIDSLMNLVMQFRKVCNHPELFERAEAKSPFCFTDIVPMSPWWKEPVPGTSGTLSASVKVPRFMPVFGSALRNPIVYEIPQLLYRRCMSRFISDCSIGTKKSLQICDIYNVASMCQSMEGEGAFSFIRFSGVSPNDVSKVAHGTILDRLLLSFVDESKASRLINYGAESLEKQSDYLHHRLFQILEIYGGDRSRFAGERSNLMRNLFCGELLYDFSIDFCLRRLPSFYMEKIVSGPVDIYCCDAQFMLEKQQNMYDSKIRSSLLLLESQGSVIDDAMHSCTNEYGLQRMNPIVVPDPRNLVFDCGKLAYLDKLLPQLKAEGHRVLIYNQMTRMIDIMEDYLNYRRYSYLRLDGSSKISDRRDMVNSWQNNDDIFVFLLSTRAGGLGINLTAADTVIFYDSDWNPTVDQQAMDRAHRLGQTRQVTVYRLITRGSIEERILQRAKQKDEIQKVVIAGGEFRQIPNAGNSAARSKEIMSLLLEDQDLESELLQKLGEKRKSEERVASLPSSSKKRQ